MFNRQNRSRSSFMYSGFMSGFLLQIVLGWLTGFVSFDVFRVSFTIITPIFRMAIQSSTLIAALVIPIIRIALHLVALPALVSYSLTG
ncbi:hypothetical protein [Pseudomonas lactis]|uniref:hypothetical protein n=1 Tax=Pseudomonas lactis TaxID=1615674 RepID=UPI0005196BB3|nr:hypothetical protein [Pseudomonas lactis]